ncbi:hypothetical protein [Streptomyces sp. NPDC005876]|uniref:hypothetical protein n=1 Tax=unclassified Streptomyces TaxID=2593676 RepID=UPI003404E9FD
MAVSQNSTRNAMFHFGRLLWEDSRATAGRKAAVIASTPGWDYAGVYTALGFEMRTFDVDSRTHFRPDHQDVVLRFRRGPFSSLSGLVRFRCRSVIRGELQIDTEGESFVGSRRGCCRTA